MVAVAIIGRPNVGKSTLFNRLCGNRHALVADIPGVTRDRRMAKASIADLEFDLVDTAGLEEADVETLAGRMTAQTLAAVDQAHIIMMMVDGRAGVIPADEHFASLIRDQGKPIILVVNKSEGKRGGEASLEAYSLGLGDPIAISAEHGEGMGELYDALVAEIDALGLDPEATDREELQIAVVGRPNVGKSTYINALLGEDRLLTGPEAGITRDAIAIPFKYEDRIIRLVDTAGMRKKSRVVRDKLEVMAVNDTRRSIQFAQVVVLMVDATQPLEKQDHQIASMIAEEGRACVLALNKWDLIDRDDRDELMDEILFQIEKVMPYYRGLPVVTLSAERKQRITNVIDKCFGAYDLWDTRIATGDLNRWLQDALDRYTPPLLNGRRLKIKYATQAKSRPPTFALFVNHKDGIPKNYERYLTNSLREHFKLPGIPIRLLTRRGKNPYDQDDKK
ncbi:MAG: ribosome biogenesis GTPase Der [Rickettsiales bacterium]|nr:ribosome biogenesis GTPase Der [Rickettsiales bacterium]